MRQLLGLLLGLIIGVAGAILFQKSLPPEEGSAEEQVEQGQVELKKARQQIKALEAQLGIDTRPGDTFQDHTRRIARDIREGREVDINDVFDAIKPVMRDVGPLFMRMGQQQQEDLFKSLAGKMTREYDLPKEQQDALKKHLKERADTNGKKFLAVVSSPASSYRDFVRVGREIEENDGLDEFMEGALQGEQREQYARDRLEEKVELVQKEADRKVEQLDGIVELDEAQKDEVFLIMARGSRHFDPAMQFEGLDSDASAIAPGQDRNEAVLQVLRPEQRQTFDQQLEQQRTETETELRAIGLKLPEDWDVLDETF